jgi:serine/threonine-protein kinase HipA
MKLEVRCNEVLVGLLNDDTGAMLFQYDERFIRSGLELSPFYLPMQQGVIDLKGPFEGGLPGLFADSLPDYWGRTIMDARLREAGIEPGRVSVLKRLALIGEGGFGALTYHPAESEERYETASLQQAVFFARKVLELGEEELPESEVLREAGSNPGGRFPKLCVGWHPRERRLVVGSQSLPEGYIPCLLKLEMGAAMPQGKAGLCRREHDMLLLAEKAGIRVPRRWLMESGDHLLVERFDRKDGGRFHMHTFSGIAHKLPVRYGSSYEELLRLVLALTGDQREVVEQYRRMVFNVLLGNRDDHVRNHAFLMEAGRWVLSPAYDLTPTPELEEQSLGVNGKWTGIGKEDLVTVGAMFSIKQAHDIIDGIAALAE